MKFRFTIETENKLSDIKLTDFIEEIKDSDNYDILMRIYDKDKGIKFSFPIIAIDIEDPFTEEDQKDFPGNDIHELNKYLPNFVEIY